MENSNIPPTIVNCKSKKPFAKIPHELLKDSDISLGAKVLYGLFDGFKPDHDGKREYNRKKLSLYLGVHIDTVSDYFKELEKQNWIQKVFDSMGRNGSKNYVKLLEEFNSPEQVKHLSGEVPEQVKHLSVRTAKTNDPVSIPIHEANEHATHTERRKGPENTFLEDYNRVRMKNPYHSIQQKEQPEEKNMEWNGMELDLIFDFYGSRKLMPIKDFFVEKLLNHPITQNRSKSKNSDNGFFEWKKNLVFQGIGFHQHIFQKWKLQNEKNEKSYIGQLKTFIEEKEGPKYKKGKKSLKDFDAFEETLIFYRDNDIGKLTKLLAAFSWLKQGALPTWDDYAILKISIKFEDLPLEIRQILSEYQYSKSEFAKSFTPISIQ